MAGFKYVFLIQITILFAISSIQCKRLYLAPRKDCDGDEGYSCPVENNKCPKQTRQICGYQGQSCPCICRLNAHCQGYPCTGNNDKLKCFAYQNGDVLKREKLVEDLNLFNDHDNRTEKRFGYCKCSNSESVYDSLTEWK